MATKKKVTEVSALRKAIVKKFGEGIVATKEEYNKGAIPTGSRMLDLQLGPQRGIPRGRVTEVFGLERTGKTTLCLETITNEQKAGGEAVLIDLEKTDLTYAAAIGVDVDKLLILKPTESSQVLDTIIECVKKGASLVVVDSVAALSPQKEKDKGIGEDTVGIVAKQMSKALRNLLDITWDNDSSVLFINQLRSDIGMFSSGYVTTGGLGLRAFGSTRLGLKRSTPIKQKNEKIYDELLEKDVIINAKRKTDHPSWAKALEIGHGSKVMIEKNKVSAPKISLEIDIIFGQGIDKESDTFEVGQYFGIMKHTGTWFYYQPGADEKDAIKVQDKFDMINILIERGLWDKFNEEVDRAWIESGVSL